MWHRVQYPETRNGDWMFGKTALFEVDDDIPYCPWYEHRGNHHHEVAPTEEGPWQECPACVSHRKAGDERDQAAYEARQNWRDFTKEGLAR